MSCAKERKPFHHPDDSRANHSLYFSAVRGIADRSNVADSHWVMLHYLVEIPRAKTLFKCDMKINMIYMCVVQTFLPVTAHAVMHQE